MHVGGAFHLSIIFWIGFLVSNLPSAWCLSEKKLLRNIIYGYRTSLAIKPLSSIGVRRH